MEYQNEKWPMLSTHRGPSSREDVTRHLHSNTDRSVIVMIEGVRKQQMSLVEQLVQVVYRIELKWKHIEELYEGKMHEDII